MRFVSMLDDQGRGRLGMLDAEGTRVLDLTQGGGADVPCDCDTLVARGAPGLTAVRRHAAAIAGDAKLWVPRGSVRLGPPLRRPGKIVAIGLNYRDHAEEQNVAPPERPLVFAKFPSAIIGPDDAIEIPAASNQIDYEVELAVVIGKRGRSIAPQDVHAHVFGYTIINDVTARDLQKSDRQWVRAKSFDTFCPMGPVLATVDTLGLPPQRDIRLRVNGELRQSSNTRQMIFDVVTLVSVLSESFTLEPGDVISTGTPAGVGVFRTPPVFLRPGDTIEAEIDGLEVLRNVVR